jgi:hypothetical protein
LFAPGVVGGFYRAEIGGTHGTDATETEQVTQGFHSVCSVPEAVNEGGHARSLNQSGGLARKKFSLFLRIAPKPGKSPGQCAL